MRLNYKKSYRITAQDEESKFIASVTDSFRRLSQVLHWAWLAAVNKNKHIGSVGVYCIDDNEYNIYNPNGKLIYKNKGIL